MNLTPQNIIHHELIGLDTEIADSINPSLIGIKGRIIDETKNTLKIETDDRIRTIPKSCSSFKFILPSFNGKRYLSLNIKVDGRLLLSQPENRIQTKFKKKFKR